MPPYPILRAGVSSALKLSFQVLEPIEQLDADPGHIVSINVTILRWPVAVMQMHGQWALRLLTGSQRGKIKCLTRRCLPCPLREACPDRDPPPRPLRLIRGSGG